MHEILSAIITSIHGEYFKRVFKNFQLQYVFLEACKQKFIYKKINGHISPMAKDIFKISFAGESSLVILSKKPKQTIPTVVFRFGNCKKSKLALFAILAQFKDYTF